MHFTWSLLITVGPRLSKSSVTVVHSFFEGRKFHRFCGFLGLPRKFFHQKLTEIHFWYGCKWCC